MTGVNGPDSLHRETLPRAPSRATHYGIPSWRTACGIFAFSDVDLTTDKAEVTCAKCRGTVKFKSEWFKPRRPRLLGVDPRGHVYEVVNLGRPVAEHLVAELAATFPDTIYFAEER